MAEMRHTAGPWAYEATSGAIYRDDGDVEPLIASTNLESVSEEQADADGRLIAAAPDLLDVASEAMDLAAYLTDYATLGGGEMAEKYGEDPSEGFNNILSRVRSYQRVGLAAISKATSSVGGK